MQPARPPLLLLTFSAAGHLFVLDVHRVYELLRTAQVAALPGAHPAVNGVFAWRGRSVPLLSLSALLDPGTPTPRPRRIVVLQAEGHTLGLGVDAVDEVVQVDPGALAEEGQSLLASLSPFLLGACVVGGRRALMLDVRPLVALVGGPAVALAANLAPAALPPPARP